MSQTKDGLRLRQVALVAGKLEPVVADFRAVLGLDIAYRDPDVAIFGLINVVMAVGDEFLEVVEPVAADASAGRYLKRRGGDAGYMVILQANDALAHRARTAALGIRNIQEMSTSKYTFTHFHPGDFGGVLTSIDSVGGVSDYLAPDGDWPPAGPDWRPHRSSPDTIGITGVAIQARDPDAAARRWSEIFLAPVEAAAEGPQLRLAKGIIRFVKPVDADGTGVVGLDVSVRDPAANVAKARERNLSVTGNSVRIGGIALNLARPA